MNREELLQWASKQTGLRPENIVVREWFGSRRILAAGDNAFRRPLSRQDQERRRRAQRRARKEPKP